MTEASLNRLNDRADLVDGAARRDIARRAAAAHDLRARSARYTAVLELALAQQLPPPLPVVGLSELARAILALVAHFVAGGAAGLEVGACELAYAFRCTSLRPVWRAVAELRDGWLIVTPILVPATQTKLGGAYVTSSDRARKGRPRSLRSDAPDAHQNSHVRNVYTMGTKALAAGLGARNEKAVGSSGDNAICTATCSALFSGSGSGSSSASLPRNAVDNSTVEAIRRDGIEGSASSPRSTFSQAHHDGDSLHSAARVLDASTPFVADPLGDVDERGDGDGSEAVDKGAPRRGLFGAMGSRLSRFFRRGEA